MPLRAFLDTCVLVPPMQRNLLLELASTQGFQALWSNVIEDELSRVIRHLRDKRKLPEKQTDRYVERLIRLMNQALPFARVTMPNANRLMPPASLPDPNDWHVIEGAIIGDADLIVTNNIKDFPDACMPDDLYAQTSDQFLSRLLNAEPLLVNSALHTISERTGKTGPKQSCDDILKYLEEMNPNFVQEARNLFSFF